MSLIFMINFFDKSYPSFYLIMPSILVICVTPGVTIRSIEYILSKILFTDERLSDIAPAFGLGDSI